MKTSSAGGPDGLRARGELAPKSQGHAEHGRRQKAEAASHLASRMWRTGAPARI